MPLSIAGASVDYYSYAWTQDPIVAGFIPESSSATGFGTSAPPNNTAAWFSASQKLNCGGPLESIPATVACMRTKKYQDILAAIVAPAGPADTVGPFSPTVDNKIVFDDYSARLKAGRFIKKPYFTGNNDYEAGLFKYTATFSGAQLSDLEWAIFNLAVFSCPPGNAARQRSQHGVPTWRYRYFGEFENLRLTVNPCSGAYHASEIYTVWRTAEDCSGVNDTAAETGISKYLQGAWAAFAKDPGGGLSTGTYNWPRYNHHGRSFWFLFFSFSLSLSPCEPILNRFIFQNLPSSVWDTIMKPPRHTSVPRLTISRVRTWRTLWRQHLVGLVELSGTPTHQLYNLSCFIMLTSRLWEVGLKSAI